MGARALELRDRLAVVPVRGRLEEEARASRGARRVGGRVGRGPHLGAARDRGWEEARATARPPGGRWLLGSGPFLLAGLALDSEPLALEGDLAEEPLHLGVLLGVVGARRDELSLELGEALAARVVLGGRRGGSPRGLGGLGSAACHLGLLLDGEGPPRDLALEEREARRELGLGDLVLLERASLLLELRADHRVARRRDERVLGGELLDPGPRLLERTHVHRRLGDDRAVDRARRGEPEVPVELDEAARERARDDRGLLRVLAGHRDDDELGAVAATRRLDRDPVADRLDGRARAPLEDVEDAGLREPRAEDREPRELLVRERETREAREAPLDARDEGLHVLGQPRRLDEDRRRRAIGRGARDRDDEVGHGERAEDDPEREVASREERARPPDESPETRGFLVMGSGSVSARRGATL